MNNHRRKFRGGINAHGELNLNLKMKKMQ